MLAVLAFGGVPVLSCLLDRSLPRSRPERFHPELRGRFPVRGVKSRQNHVVFRQRTAGIKPAGVFGDAPQRSNLVPSHQSTAGNATISVP
jgi:hypothetical protein